MSQWTEWEDQWIENYYEETSREGGFLLNTGQGFRHQRWEMKSLIKYQGFSLDLLDSLQRLGLWEGPKQWGSGGLVEKMA